MGKRFAIILMFALALASCTVNTRYSTPGDRMVFTAVASHSRCIIGTTYYPTNIPFVVEAVHYPEGLDKDWEDIYIAEATVEYDKDNAWWQSEDEFYWPQMGDVVFYAASPAVPKINISPDKGLETDWSIHSFEEAQVDLCFAKTVENCSRHSALIPIVFSHALTQVCVKVRPLKQYSKLLISDNLLQTDEITVVLDSLKINGILCDGHFTQEPLTWTTRPGTTANYTIFNDPAGLALECDSQNSPVLTPLKPLLLIPQVLPDDATIEEWHHTVVHSTLKDITTGAIITDLSYTVPASASYPIWSCCQKWLSNYKYTFRLTIGMESEDGSLSLAVTDWVETSEIILDE